MSEVGKVAAEVETSAMEMAAVEGLAKIANEVVAAKKLARDVEKSTDERLKKGLEDLEGKMNKSVEDLIGRVNRLKEHSSVLGRALLDIAPGDDQLKSVIPEHVKMFAGAFEAAARQQRKGSALSDPTTYMAVNAWFAASTRSQLRKFAATASKDAQLVEGLFAALQEKHFGPQWEAITKASLQEDTATEGGNLVPTIVESDIVRQVMDAGKLFPMARQVQMNKKVHQVPNESAAVTVNWVAEEGTLTGGEPTFGQKTLTAKKLAGRATMSIELVEDSNPGLLAYLLEVFTEKMGGELDKQLVLGDGSSPAITGIDNTSGINVISSSATAAGRALTWQLLVNTFFGSGESTAVENGYWIVSPKGYATILGLADSTGQPIVKDVGREGTPAGTLLGRPVLFSQRWGGTPSGVTATLDDTTNTNVKIIYGVPRSLLFGTRTGFRWDVTDQVNWATFQMDARLVGRFAMIVGVPKNFSRLSKVNY